MKSRIVFDLEGNRLLYSVSKLWCICAIDLGTGERYKFYGDTFDEGVSLLQTYDLIIGHNITGYDLLALQKFYPHFNYKGIRDTYIMSKLFNPDRTVGHSLESYGEEFGRKKPEHEDWSQFSEAMLHRCSEDCEINKILYESLVNRFCRDWSWLKALELEQEFALYQARQELAGVDFDLELANRLLVQIDSEVESLDQELQSRIPKRVKQVGATVTKPFKKDGTYTKQVSEWITLNSI